MEGNAIDWGLWKLVLDGAALMISLAAGAIALWVKQRQVTEEAIDELQRRVATVEARVESLPTAVSFAAVREDLAEIRGDVRASAAEIHGLGAGMKRIENLVGLLMENELRGKKG